MEISLLLFIYLLHGINGMETSLNLMKYLDERAKIVGEELIRHARNPENFYTVKLNEVNNVKLIGNYSSGEIFTFFRKPYVVLDREMMEISQNNYISIETFSSKEKIIFWKTIEYQNLGFLLFATNHNVRIFGFSKNQTENIFKIQNILHVNLTDAAFFKSHDNLYLIVSTYKSYDFTSVIVYKFTNSYFDETEIFSTSGPTKLHTFSNNGSEIIIAFSQRIGMASSLYEFKYDKILKLHKVDTKNAKEIVSWTHYGKQYVMFFNNQFVHQYLWTGTDLLFLQEFPINFPLTGTKSVFSTNNNSYLMVSNNTKFVVFSLTNMNFFDIRYVEFNTNWTNIWDHIITEGNVVVALGKTTQNTVEIKSASIFVEDNLQRQQIIEEEKLASCFLTLEKSVYFLRNKITDVENGTLKLRDATDGKNNEFPMKKWENLQTKYSTVKTVVESKKTKILVINKPAIVNIANGTKRLTGADIRFSKLNSQIWRPETWLSYSQPQTISAPVKIQQLKSDSLQTKYHEPLLHDLMYSKPNQIFSGSLKTKNLNVDRLETKFLNNIPMSNFYYKSQPVEIKGLKSFPNLKAQGIYVADINGIDATTILSDPNVSTSDNFTIKNLWVKNINSIDFEKLKNSVFRIGLDTIDGNLTFHNLEAEKMSFQSLSKMSSVLTTSTNQTVNSTIKITTMFANNVRTNLINDIDFKNAATFDDKIIKGPVSLKNLNIKNNLELKGDIDQEFLLFNNTHIIGTNESDFLQRYNGNVTIKGNLILSNFNLARTARIFVNGKKFNPEINQFWRKTTPQTIPKHFEARNGVSSPHLYTTFINGVNVADYMLNSTQSKSGRFYFDSVIVKGNVLLDPDKKHSPNFEKIQQESVKTNGTFRIKGKKTYSRIIKVDTLEVDQLDSHHDLLGVNVSLDSGPKKVRNMVIKGDLNVEKLIVKQINNVNLKNLTENVVYIDKPQKLSKLNFQNVTAQNLFIISTVNGNNMSNLLTNLKNIQNTKTIEAVYVKDNVNINNVDNLLTINSQKVDELLHKTRTLYNNNTIFVPTKFTGDVKIKDLYILTVNNVNLQAFSRRILYKSWNQPITKPYTFTKLTTKNLITEKINNIDLKNIIDVSKTQPQTIISSHGLKMTKPVKIQNLDGKFGCDLHDSLTNLHSPVSQFWDNVVVTGNAVFWDKESLMNRIFDEVVTHEKINPVIKGQVQFEKHISVNNITALKNINSVDIMEIIKDAVINKPGTKQIITGKKSFIRLEADTLVSLQNTNVSTINNIKISEIDSKIVSKNAIPDVPIKGHKLFFGGLQTKKLETASISGVNVGNLVSFENEAVVPNAMFEAVNVLNNFNVTFVNKMPFEVFLSERLLKQALKQTLTGNFFFKNINITGNITTASINDISIENIVFDVGTQVINSPKKITNNMKIIGNVSVDFINGLELSKYYEKAVLNNEETNFTGIYLMKPTFLEGSIQTQYINEIPVEYMLDTSAKYNVQVEAQQIHEITKILANFINKYMNISRKVPTEILYLEKSKDLQIPLSNTVSAHVVETKDAVLIHVESEEDGTVCGLEPLCKCPMQQTMQISPQKSFNVFMNKAMQRIYSYYNDDIIVHVITHSISSRSECRTNTTRVMNEISSLTWNLPPQKNNSGGFFVHQTFLSGFISTVEFFTIYGRTYVVIGTYYDAVLDTHNVDILVYRFNENKTAIEEIQKFPSKGLKIISAFPTAQGFVLILGNGVDNLNNTTTRILRFNQQNEKFEILREVPSFGTLHAQGVVLERDSLIILANKHSHLLILKYHADFDNYYLYQTFQLHHPVSSMSIFYAEGFGISDVYLTVVTTNHEFFIYSFWFIEGWKLEFSGEIKGLTNLVPFKLNGKPYLLAPSTPSSSLLNLVKHDSD